MVINISKKIGLGIPFFRNDDVSYDTQLEYFRKFCEIFWKYGLLQTHAITLCGLCNYSTRYNGSHTVYENYPTLSKLSNDTIITLSQPYNFNERKDLIQFLSEIPDNIALHGLYHTNYSLMSFDEQYNDMSLGLEILKDLFPTKKILFFVPPFNKYNFNTLKVANALGLRILGTEGVHLENSLENLNLYPGVWYRYHHHRFYPESTFDSLDLTMEKLDMALAKGMKTVAAGDYLSFWPWLRQCAVRFVKNCQLRFSA